MKRAFKELVDFWAHAGSAMIVLVVSWIFGVFFTDLGAVFIAWSLGFVREMTEWQDGGNHPFTRWGLLDQAGWIMGGILFCLVMP
ncbi:MAG TPA: hypothetical protein VM531_07270 [Sphingomicrobium sp.]|jgi:hypothetical protein|nr:hypothetical protein [Sphingomicrobium sp.]